ncbi:MAG: pyrroloquinoline quinone biosynthesis peptide chaperone PqqD [Gammaproteobacteria bacterium]
MKGEEILPTSIPKLAPTFRFQWEEAQNCYVLLYPEGMVNLSGSAGEILKRCDGETTVEGILSDLQTAFPDADIEKDVYNFIGHAYDNGWLKSAG